MAERVTQTIVDIEYVESANRRRVTQAIANVEYVETINKMCTTQVIVMVEYATHAPISGRKFGPAAQTM